MQDQINHRFADFAALSRDELRDTQGGECPTMECLELNFVQIDYNNSASGGIDSTIRVR
jgi:hypothetical protein